MAARKTRSKRQTAKPKKTGLVQRARLRVKTAGEQVKRRATAARDRYKAERDAENTGSSEPILPHLCLVQAPVKLMFASTMSEEITVATYNVHRWTGMNGRAKPDAARAGYVITELAADIIALQEVIRPTSGEDPLSSLCNELGYHLAFAVTRMHRNGQLGNAILSRFPLTALSVVDISHSKIERRGALTAQVGYGEGALGIIATHLSLVDRTRHRQVQVLLDHPQLNTGPAILMGDMNAWRKCKASTQLEDDLHRHHNIDWPSSFPAARPILALDRVYARDVAVLEVSSHDTAAARKASDHLPIVARIKI